MFISQAIPSSATNALGQRVKTTPGSNVRKTRPRSTVAQLLTSLVSIYTALQQKVLKLWQEDAGENSDASQ